MSGLGQATELHACPGRRWRRYRLSESLTRYGILLFVLVFLTFSIDYLNVHVDRLLMMFGRVGDLLAHRYYPPDIPYVLEQRYLGYVLQTVQMAFLGAALGLALSAPLAWFASVNVTPSRRFVYPLARLVIMGCRSVHEMIWAILFVSILGFGVLPGVCALTLFSIGFAGKLLAEEVESISRGPVEAVRATGANLFQVVLFAVLPQVKVAWMGIAIYTWDVAFRAATVVGFFGAGGMGWYLKRSVQQIETQRVAAILISIVVLVIAGEVFSAWARARVARS